MASFLQKLSPIYSLGRWLLVKGSLVWYMHPSDDELRKVAGKPVQEKLNGKVKHRRYAKHQEIAKTFKISKKMHITLDAQRVTLHDVVSLKLYADYEWLVNYTLFGILVYIATEMYYEVWKPYNDFNLSVVWLGLSLWFAFKNLSSILWLYAKSKAAGEISLSVAYGLVSFMCALAVLMVDENVLEFGLQKLPNEEHLSNEKHDMHAKPLSVSSVKVFLAICSMFVGVLFIFPAIRQAQMYLDAIKYCGKYSVKAFALHFNFISTLLVSLLWLKPVARDAFQFPGLNITDNVKPAVSDAQFDIFRIVFVMFICFLRLTLIRLHLQAYLNIAYDKVQRLRKESGLITNTELQRMIVQTFYYLGVVATQYVSPIAILLCSALWLKTLGGYSWNAVLPSYKYNTSALFSQPSITSTLYSGEESYTEMAEKVRERIADFKSLFTPMFLRGVLSFAVWWTAANWFVASCVGLLYHWYLSE